eukprot:scaffold124342_cov40-Attheya_sp.AAC.3
MPKEIVQHLQDTFFDDEESEEDILKQYKIMNIKYDPSDLVQVYFKALQDARTILASHPRVPQRNSERQSPHPTRH